MMATSTFAAFAATCDSDLRFIPCGTRQSAKAPLDVTTGGGLKDWGEFGVDCDELGDLLDSAAHQPRAIGINLSKSGVVCLDCDEEGWPEDLADLAECSTEELKAELGQLSRVISPRFIVGKQQAVKFLFRLPAEDIHTDWLYAEFHRAFTKFSVRDSDGDTHAACHYAMRALMMP